MSFHLRLGDSIGFQDYVGIQIHLCTEVLVKDKAQYIISEVIGTHFPAQGVGDVPQLLFEFCFLLCHLSSCLLVWSFCCIVNCWYSSVNERLERLNIGIVIGSWV